MGFLLKIALLGIALYGIWRTFSRWKGLYDRFVGRPETPPAPPPAPQPPPVPPSQPVLVEDTRLCPVCNAYVSVSETACGRAGCPQPPARSA